MELPIQIGLFLPHRAPMLMVDEIVEIDDQSIKTEFIIKPENIFLQNSKLSEVGIIENMAQTASGIIGKPQFDENAHDKNFRLSGYITRIENIEIFTLPDVNAQLETYGKLVMNHTIGNMFNCKIECKTYQGEKTIAKGFFNLIIRPQPL